MKRKLIILIAAVGGGWLAPVAGQAQITNLFAGNSANGTITEFDANGNVVKFGIASAITVGGNPFALTLDRTGDLFVANSSLAATNTAPAGEIQEITAASLASSFVQATTFATGLTGLSSPVGLAFDSSGDLFVANEDSSVISEYDSAGVQMPFTVTGATVSTPTAMTIDGNDNLLVAQIGGASESILKINPDGVATTLVSGLSFPNALAINNQGGLFVSEESSGEIAEIKNGAAVPVITLPAFAVNGLAFDQNGDLFIAEGHQGLNNILELTNNAGTLSANATTFTTASAGGASGGLAVSPVAIPPTLPPLINGVNLSGAKLVLAAVNGKAGQTYATQMSTNLNQWTSVATNTLNASGDFSLTNAVNGNLPQAFYRLLQLQ